MDDIAYTYKTEQRERKSASRNARYRKSGAKSKRCSLPHDRLTNKQLRERNGKMITYNLNGKMVWREYKAMPDDLKREYLLKLKREHRARSGDVAEMLGIRADTFSKELTRLGINEFSQNRIRIMTDEWKLFINGENTPQESAETKEVKVPSEDINAANTENSGVKQAQNVLKLTNGQLFFVGEPAAVFGKLMLLLDPSINYNIGISFFENDNRP